MRPLLALPLVLLIAAAPAPDQLSDASLVKLARSDYDRAEKFKVRREVLGINLGQTVIAEYFCSDICPAYTTRVIRYDLAPGAACEKAGGVTKEIMIPVSIAVMRKPFCVPRAIAGITGR